jgi:hypothetical protein
LESIEKRYAGTGHAWGGFSRHSCAIGTGFPAEWHDIGRRQPQCLSENKLPANNRVSMPA